MEEFVEDLVKYESYSYSNIVRFENLIHGRIRGFGEVSYSYSNIVRFESLIRGRIRRGFGKV